MKISGEQIGLMYECCIDKFGEMIRAKNAAPSDRFYQTYESLVEKLRDYYSGVTEVLDLSISELYSLTVSVAQYYATVEGSRSFDENAAESLLTYLKGVLYCDY